MIPSDIVDGENKPTVKNAPKANANGVSSEFRYPLRTKKLVQFAEDVLLMELRRALERYTVDTDAVSMVFALWYMLWFDIVMLVKPDTAVSLLNKGTVVRWTKDIGAVDIPSYFSLLSEQEDLILKSSVQELLHSCAIALGTLVFPCSAQISKTLLSESPCKGLSWLTHVRTILNFPTRFALSDVDDGVEKWIAVENSFEHPPLGEYDRLRLAAKPWLLPAPAASHSTRFSSGAVADAPKMKGQQAKKCVLEAYASKKVYRDLYKAGCVFPGVSHIGSQTAKMVSVPKNYKTQRVIVEEPAFNSWIQHRFQRSLCQAVRHRWGNSVNPIDPTWNREHVSSLDYASIDLSSASDSISVAVAMAVMPSSWRRIIMATRTKEVLLPDRTVHTLQKISGMGNALTFPLECHVFASIVEYARIRGGFPPQPFGVFGDDILVPRNWYGVVIAALKVFGFTPNTSKSWSSPFLFRESCGYDYFNERLCTPLRVPRSMSQISNEISGVTRGKPKKPRDTKLLQGCVHLTNTLWIDGYTTPAQYLKDVLRRSGAKFSSEFVISEDKHGHLFVYPLLFSPNAGYRGSNSFEVTPERQLPVRLDDEWKLVSWALASPATKIVDGVELTDYPWVINGTIRR